jgi:hypothetical protein
MKLTSGEIYFIREIEVHSDKLTPFVKIGIVREPKKGEERTSIDRALEHQTGNPRKLFVDSIFKTPAVSEVENILHKLHAYDRVEGEWFQFTEEQLCGVKKRTKELTNAAIENEENFRIASDLSNKESKEEMIRPSMEIIAWHKKIIEADFRIDECEKLQTEIKEFYKSELDEPFTLEAKKERQKELLPFIKVQEKKTQSVFDIKTFKKNHSDLYSKFSRITRTSPRGSFIITRPKEWEFVLEQIDQELHIYSQIARQTISESKSGKRTQKELHTVTLTLLGYEAKASWDKEIAKANLKIFCQDYAGIEGLCKWNRKPKEQLVFDESAFFEAHPRIAKNFVVEIESKPSLIVSKKRTYPHFIRKGS